MTTSITSLTTPTTPAPRPRTLPPTLIGIGITGGLITGVMLWVLTFVNPIKRPSYFHDKGFWNLPSDYDYVINEEFIKTSEGDEELEPVA